MENMQILDLSNCGFFDAYKVQKIMQVLNEIDSLVEVSFIQHPEDEDTIDETEGYLKIILKMMKKNFSIQKLVLFEDASVQNER